LVADFTHYDLGHLKRGSTVVVTLSGNAANVRLLDSTNFNSFRQGRQHRYHGGLAKRSPVRLGVPSDGRWHVTVDLMGLGGSVRSAVGVEPPPPAPLPAIREGSAPRPPLAAIVDNIEAVAPESPAVAKAYDVFISHATEDKDAVVRDLANALAARGLEVWYDEFTLRIGDNLRRRIDAGLASSRFGVVVLSPSFFAKEWSQYELDGLVTRELQGAQQIILPLWHNISPEEVGAQSPSLANKLALRTDRASIEEIADQIAEVVTEGRE
jgi:hypothetical protein